MEFERLIGALVLVLSALGFMYYKADKDAKEWINCFLKLSVAGVLLFALLIILTRLGGICLR